MNEFQNADYKFGIILAVQIIGFLIIFFKIYAKSYTAEKGKNLATKQDIGEITEIVESIKTALSIKTEELKSDLSYKNEHLIHLRATERAAIVNYYKTTWVLVLNFSRIDLVSYNIDNYNNSDRINDDLSHLTYLKEIISEAERGLNKIKDELSNLKYLKDISESELMFFYDEPELAAVTEKLNLSLSELERSLLHTINLLLQVFIDAYVKINNEQLSTDVANDMQRKRSEILTQWYEHRRNYFAFIRTFNKDLKDLLLKRLTGLTF